MDEMLEQYSTYEEYLTSYITDTDRYYLEDEDLCRQMIELGVHTKGDIYTREQFMAQKETNARVKKAKAQSAPRVLSSANKDLSAYPFLQKLAEREEDVRNGRLTTIIFIRDVQVTKGNTKREISGYIDYAHRLKTENFDQYFNVTNDRPKRLLPKTTDLSYFNWDSGQSTSNESPNFRVDANSEVGLQFKNKRDRKVINVNPKAESPGDNTKRIEIETHEYVQVVLYDHFTRRRN